MAPENSKWQSRVTDGAAIIVAKLVYLGLVMWCDAIFVGTLVFPDNLQCVSNLRCIPNFLAVGEIGRTGAGCPSFNSGVKWSSSKHISLVITTLNGSLKSYILPWIPFDCPTSCNKLSKPTTDQKVGCQCSYQSCDKSFSLIQCEYSINICVCINKSPENIWTTHCTEKCWT